MSRILAKDYRLFLFISSLSILFSALVFQTIYPLHFGKQPLFVSDLLGFSISLPVWLIYIFGFLDLFLVWLVGKMFFKRAWVYLLMLLFGLSPWFIYSVVSGSFYIYLLCLVLIIFLALYLIKSGKQKLGGLVFIISSILLLYSSIIAFLSYFLFVCGFILLGFIPFSKIKLNLILILIICLPLFILMFKNPVGIKNILNNQVNFLLDPGLINSINVFQGESKKEDFGYFSRLSENKYVYLSRYIILKFTKNTVPSAFFTSEEKLLGFSFAPPIYLGLLIPFLYGVYLILISKTLRKYLILSLVLIIPSFLSKKMVDLNRLILFEPVVIFIVIYGLKKINDKKSRLTSIILFLCSILILIQFGVTIFDINFREYPRLERFYGVSHWQLDKQ